MHWYNIHEDGPFPCYLDWNVNALNEEIEEGDGRFSHYDIILLILEAVYAKASFMELHAAVKGCACRPWYLWRCVST